MRAGTPAVPRDIVSATTDQLYPHIEAGRTAMIADNRAQLRADQDAAGFPPDRTHSPWQGAQVLLCCGGTGEFDSSPVCRI